MRGKLKDILMKLTLATTTIAFLTPNFSAAAAAENSIGAYEEHVKSVNVLTEVQSKDGEKVIAVAIEYDTIIDGSKMTSSDTDINSVYSIEASDPSSVVSPRTVTKVYTNDTPSVASEGKSGNYVIVELDTKDLNSGTFYFSFATFLNDRHIDYKVSQVKDIFTVNGDIISSSAEKLSHTAEINPEVDKFGSAVYENSDGKLNYRYFTPNVQDGEKYPLVIFLHGAGERGNNTSLQLYGYRAALAWATPENQAKNPSFVFAPQATTDNPDVVSTWPGNKALLAGIQDFIAKNPVDTNRIYITGMSMGGFGTWSLILNNPDLFAAAVPICGGGDTSLVANVVDLPIWAFHGEDDPIVKVEGSRSLVQAIKDAGGTKVKYTEYPAGTLGLNAHNSWDLTYANEEMIDWVYSQSKREEADITDITANTYIGDAGQMVDNFEITIDDISKVEGLKAEDFDITNNYDGYPLNSKGELVKENYTEDGISLTISGNIIKMDVKDFKYDSSITGIFNVISDKYPELTFTSTDVTKVNTKTVDKFEKLTFTGSNGVTIPYRLYSANTGKAEPLVIWMHGAGEVGTDNIKHITANRGAVAFAESGFTTNVIAAQYPYKYSVELTDKELQDMKAFFNAYEELINKLVKEGKVDPNKIYLTGASMGGGLTLRFLLEKPDLFAASVAIASRGTVKDLTELEAIKDLPIWLFHAKEDPTNVSSISENIYNKLKELGNDEAKLTIYSTEFMNSLKLYGGLLHWSWVPTLNDSEMMKWLFAQSKEVIVTPDDEVVPVDNENSNSGQPSVDVDTSNTNKNSGNTSKVVTTLPKTGTLFDMSAVLLLSMSLVCSGLLLIRKRVRN